MEEERDRLGVLVNDMVYDMEVLHPDLPTSMSMFLNYWEDAFPVAQAGELMLREGTRTSNRGVPLNDVQLLAPIPFPTSCRDGYAFRQHVKPGITGLAQVRGLRGETRELASMQKRIDLDLWYIANWTVWLDLRILARTALEVFRRRNAY